MTVKSSLAHFIEVYFFKLIYVEKRTNFDFLTNSDQYYD